MRAQSVSLGGARARVAGGDRGLQRVRADRRRRAPRRARARPARAGSAADPSARGPGRAAGSARPSGRRARASARPGSPSARRGRAPPARRARARRGCGRAAARPRTARAHPVVAGGRRVALVEDQVDDLEHRRQPRGELGAARHLERHAAPRRACAWRARCAARSSAPATRNARAISSVVRPPSRRSVSATRASVDSTGWQAVKIRRSRSSPIVVVERRRRDPASAPPAAPRARVPSSSCLRSSSLLAAQLVDRAVLGGGHQPGAGVVAARPTRATARARRPARPARAPRPARRRARCARGRRSVAADSIRQTASMARWVSVAVTATDQITTAAAAQSPLPDYLSLPGSRMHLLEACGGLLARPRGSPTSPAPGGPRSSRSSPAGQRVAHSIASSSGLDLDHPVAAEHFLGLGERAVGHLRLAAGEG